MSGWSSRVNVCTKVDQWIDKTIEEESLQLTQSRPVHYALSLPAGELPSMFQ